MSVSVKGPPSQMETLSEKAGKMSKVSHSHVGLLTLAAILTLAVSCGSSAKLLNTATYQRMDFQPYVTPVQVDLEVSPQKIEYLMLVSKTVSAGGYDNVVATAVREALESNGGWDVLVGMQAQTKYTDQGEIESILVSGFPAKYVNFRSNDQLPMTAAPAKVESAGGLSLFGKKK